MSTPNRQAPSSLRAEQARLTRRRIIDAAQRLFIADGYTATTIDAIARAADVSVQTVYNSVGSKSAALVAAYDIALAGDEAPVPISERPTFQAMLAATSGRNCLAQYAALGRELAERATPLLAVIVGEAGNPDVRALADTIERQREIGTASVASHVAERFGLRADLEVQNAADILWALTAPEVTIRLVQARQWSWYRYETWLAAAMADSLLGPQRRSQARQSH